MYNVPLEININNIDKTILNELIKSYLSHISHEVYLISKYIRSCSWIDLPEALIPHMELAIINLLKSEKIQYYILPFDLMPNNIMHGYIQIFIYKFDWQKRLFVHFINKRNTIIGDFIFGKLLGYSDQSVNEYFIKNNIHIL